MVRGFPKIDRLRRQIIAFQRQCGGVDRVPRVEFPVNAIAGGRPETKAGLMEQIRGLAVEKLGLTGG